MMPNNSLQPTAKRLRRLSSGVNRQKIIDIFLENESGMTYYHTGGDENDGFKNCHYNRRQHAETA